MALAESEVEKDLGLDGVTEGVIYAAGAGCIQPGQDWRAGAVPEQPRQKKSREAKDLPHAH
jgi:hypothetical protein